MDSVKQLVPYPHDDNGRPLPTASDVCDGCGNLDPWSPGAAPAFYAIISRGQKTFVHQLPRTIRKLAASQGCLQCRLLACVLAITDPSSSSDDMIKVRISAETGSRGLIIGHRKIDRIEVFIPPELSPPEFAQLWPAIGIVPAIARNSSHVRCFDLIKTWLGDCRSTHAGCRSNADVPLPTRLIHVGKGAGPPRLVSGTGLRGEYLTLSYCWGVTRKGLTLRENLGKRMSHLPIDTLCKTHQDAITITRQLGFQFLWIDALCIVQDDTIDWERESAVMYSIYRNSALTIAASHASDGDNGIFSDRPADVLANIAVTIVPRFAEDGEDKEEASQEAREYATKTPSEEGSSGSASLPCRLVEDEELVPHTDRNGEAGETVPELTTIADPGSSDTLSPHSDGEAPAEVGRPTLHGFELVVSHVDEIQGETVMDTDTLIEGVRDLIGPSVLLRRPVFSHKVYYYGFHQENDAKIFPLEDRAWCFQETILATRVVHFGRDELVWQCREAALCECGSMSTEGGTTTRHQFDVLLRDTERKKRSDTWMKLVEKYTKRKLGNEKDRLPALSGLARSMQEEYGYGQYMAGLWKEFLPDQLLWSTMCGYKATRAKEYRAPTWSFASVENATYFSNALDSIFKTDRDFLTKVLDVECRQATVDPTGIVQSGHITLTGPVQHSTLDFGERGKHFDDRFVTFVVNINGKSRSIAPDYRIMEPSEHLSQTRVGAETLPPDTDVYSTAIPVAIMAICTENRGQMRIGDKGADSLHCLVLKAACNTLAPGGNPSIGDKATGPLPAATTTYYQRIGLLELDRPSEPQEWLAGAQQETITIL